MRKRLIAILLCISTMLSLCTGFASAASSTIGGALGEVNITNGGYKMSYLSMNGVVRSQSYTYFNFKSASGAIKEIPAYCINPTTKGVPQSVNPGESIKYIANEASSDPKIMGIIANGYPHKGLSELKLDNKQQAYYATKMALWCYLIDDWSIDRLTLNPSLSGAEKERGEKILAAAKNIYKNGIWWNRVPQPTITVTADKDSAYPVTIDGKEYLQQVFTADSETWVCDYDIDIAFTMPDEVPEGTRIVDMNNNDITKIRTSSNGASYAGQFKVLYPKDSVTRPARCRCRCTPMSTSMPSTTRCVRKPANTALCSGICATPTLLPRFGSPLSAAIPLRRPIPRTSRKRPLKPRSSSTR